MALGRSLGGALLRTWCAAQAEPNTSTHVHNNVQRRVDDHHRFQPAFFTRATSARGRKRNERQAPQLYHLSRRVGAPREAFRSSAASLHTNMPDDRAAEADELSTLMATLRIEMEERNQRVEHLQHVLSRKTEEREVLFQNYQEMLGQVQILRQLVTQRLGLPEPADTTPPLSPTPAHADPAPTPALADPAPAEVANQADSVPSEHAAPADPVFWEQWVARVEAEVSSGKAVLDESLARSAQAGRDSLAQLRDGWTRGVGGLVNGFGGIAPRQAGQRSSTGER